MSPDRLVFGVVSEWAGAELEAAFAPLLADGVPLVVTDLATAELVKVSANSFLATKISFINAMAEVCGVAGADVQALATALSYDPRIGGRFLRPGLGFGGGCLPKDIRAYIHRAKELGIGQAVSFLREVDAINQRRRQRTVDLVRAQAGGSLRDVPVCALGAAFKPDSDDIRDAPALDVARLLQEEGAIVRVYDPEAMDNARRAYPDLHYADSVAEAAAGARVVALLTEWDQFRNINPAWLGDIVEARAIVEAIRSVCTSTGSVGLAWPDRPARPGRRRSRRGHGCVARVSPVSGSMRATVWVPPLAHYRNRTRRSHHTDRPDIEPRHNLVRRGIDTDHRVLRVRADPDAPETLRQLAWRRHAVDRRDRNVLRGGTSRGRARWRCGR